MTSPDEGPEWADEAHLDEVFSTWVPGPPDSASATEKEMAGNNPPIEISEEGVSDQDIEAALAAALAEAELLSADAQDPDLLPAPPEPPAATRPEPSEPASPSWLNVSGPEVPAAGTMAPVPISEPEPDPVFDPEPESDATFVDTLSEPESDPVFQSAPNPVSGPVPEPEPVFHTEPGPAFDPVPQPEPVLEAQPAPEPVTEPPPPPPPEASQIARPWSRSDDDIIPERKGKGRRR